MFDDLIPQKPAASGGLFDDLIPAKTGEKAGPPAPERGWLEYLNNVARAAANGVTFGFADELAGLAGSAGNKVARTIGADIPEKTYSEIREQEDRGIRQFRETDPGAAYGAEIGGAVVAPLGAAKTALQGGRTALQALKAGVGTGAASGALYGAGEAEKAEDIPAAMAAGTVAGGLGGGVIPAAKVAVPAAVRLAAPVMGNPVFGGAYALGTGNVLPFVGQIVFRGLQQMIGKGGDDMAKAVKTIVDSTERTSGDDLANVLRRAYEGAQKLENQYERDAVLTFLSGVSGAQAGSQAGRAAVISQED